MSMQNGDRRLVVPGQDMVEQAARAAMAQEQAPQRVVGLPVQVNTLAGTEMVPVEIAHMMLLNTILERLTELRDLWLES